MKIFDRRPLASILCIFLFGFVAFSQGEVWLRIITAAIAPLLLIFSIFKTKIKKLLIFLCASITFAMLFSYAYFDLYFFPDDRVSGTAEIIGTVYDTEKANGYGKIIFISDSIGDDSFPSYKLVMYCNEEDAARINPGDKIKFRGAIKSFDKDSEGDLRRYYASLGISAKCELSDFLEIISHGDPPTEYKLSTYREALTRRAMMLSDNYSGRLISALILGERDSLSEKTQLDFRRIGLTHMLALSGMHLAILSIGITKLLGFFGVGKRTAGIVNIFLTIGYMVLTGLPLSVVRAGIMLIIASLLFAFIGSHDSLTSLSIAVFLIIIFNPTSIFDISLWLSAFATLGMVVFGEYSSSNQNRRKRPERDERPPLIRALFGALNWIKLSLLSSVFAISSTILLSMVDFQGVSILSALSTVLLTPVITVFMYLAVLTLLIGGFVPIGVLLSPLSSLVEIITSWLSSFNNIYVSTGYASTIILSVLITTLLFVFFTFNLKRIARKIALCLVAALLFSTYLTSFCLGLSVKNDDDIMFINEVSASTFVLKSEGKSALICSATYNDLALSYVNVAMNTSHLTELDYYIATHYGFGLINHLKAISASYKIRTLVLPRPRSDDEKAILNWLIKSADEYGAKIEFFESKTPYVIGSLGITLNHSTVYGEDTIRAAFTIDDGDVKYTYLSEGMLLDDFANFTYRITKDSDVIIFGSHGKSYKDTANIYEGFNNTETFILCSDNLYFTQSSYDLYVDRGCKIYSHPKILSIKQ